MLSLSVCVTATRTTKEQVLAANKGLGSFGCTEVGRGLCDGRLDRTWFLALYMPYFRPSYIGRSVPLSLCPTYFKILQYHQVGIRLPLPLVSSHDNFCVMRVFHVIIPVKHDRYDLLNTPQQTVGDWLTFQYTTSHPSSVFGGGGACM